MKLGTYVVWNRTNEEVKKNISFEEAWRLEKKLFSTNKELMQIQKERCGFENLTNKLIEL